jgi:DNA-binding PucR family transcriptional regulator
MSNTDAALHIHDNTLYPRVERPAELLGTGLAQLRPPAQVYLALSVRRVSAEVRGD